MGERRNPSVRASSRSRNRRPPAARTPLASFRRNSRKANENGSHRTARRFHGSRAPTQPLVLRTSPAGVPFSPRVRRSRAGHRRDGPRSPNIRYSPAGVAVFSLGGVRKKPSRTLPEPVPRPVGRELLRVRALRPGGWVALQFVRTRAEPARRRQSL